MLGWITRLGTRGALVLSMFGLTACYKSPEPDCGFVCGPSGACPDDYRCATDNRCHRNGTPGSLVCGTDAGVAGVDAAMTDARGDADVTAPTVTGTVPANSAMSVDLATTIAVTFNESVTNVDLTSFSVSQASTPITGVIAASGGGTVYTFTPSAALPNASTITVTLSSAITDAAGNPLATVTFTFTTA